VIVTDTVFAPFVV
jgi:hypothetical protein